MAADGFAAFPDEPEKLDTYTRTSRLSCRHAALRQETQARLWSQLKCAICKMACLALARGWKLARTQDGTQPDTQLRS